MSVLSSFTGFVPKYPSVINEAANNIIPTLLYMPLYLILCTFDLSSHGTTKRIAMLAAKIINQEICL